MDAIIESLENALQIAVLGICGIFSLVRMHSVREKSYLLLFAFYGSFLLGDLYWQVCLLCLGDIPRISIVSDLSWYAALLFLYLLLRAAGEAEVSDGAAAAFSVNKGLPWLAPVFTAAMAVFFIQNGKIASNIVYAVLMGILLYTAVKGLLRTETGKGGFRRLYSRTLKFDYRPLQKSTYMKRKIDPYHVVCQRGNWYVIGFCHDKGDVRIFSLGRMKNLALMEQRFSVPKDFKPSDYFDAEMGVWLSDKTPLTVELLFSQEIATFALNHVWHSEQIIEEKPDGSVYVKFQTTQKQEIIRWVLGQGRTVKVLAPPELAEEVKAELKKAAELYD